MHSYDKIRQQYQPDSIKVLLIAESPPPSANTASSRHFYRSETIRTDDRLFTNTIKALYPETDKMAGAELEQQKEKWLRKLQADGWYMIEALKTSLRHGVSRQERQHLIRENLPKLIERLHDLTDPGTKIILIKSNVFEAAAEPLRNAGFKVLNTELVDYPGHFNQRAYRNKLTSLVAKNRQL